MALDVYTYASCTISHIIGLTEIGSNRFQWRVNDGQWWTSVPMWLLDPLECHFLFFSQSNTLQIYHYWWQLLVKQYLAVTHMKPCKTGAGTIDCFCVCCWVKGRDTWRQWGPGWLCLVTEKSLVISTFVFVFIQSFPFLASDLLIQVRWWKSKGVIFLGECVCHAYLPPKIIVLW